MTTPMFTPDGRLLQVEYASIAAQQRSLPIVALVLREYRDDSPENNNKSDPYIKGRSDNCANDFIVLGCMRKANSCSQQRRLIPLSTTISCTNSDNMCVGMSGVLSDAVSLLQEVRKHFEGWERTYGANSSNVHSNSVERVANVIGDKCQSHAFGGGLRPYGASLLLCGFDVNQRANLCVTYPSGSVNSINVESRLGRTADNLFCMVTGEGSLSEKLRQSTLRYICENEDENINELPSEPKSILRRGVDAILMAMFEEYQESNDHKSLVQEVSTGEFRPEVLILSSKGAHIIEGDELDFLIRRIQEQYKSNAS